MEFMNLAKDKYKSAFDAVFEKIDTKATLIKDLDHLNRIAAAWVTTKTKYGTSVYNNERYFARIKKYTKHTTFLRDDQITTTDLENVTKCVNKIPSDTEIYKLYILAGSGSQKQWIEMFFTPEGVKLAQVAEIMMKASFDKPKAEVTCKFLAVPEYQDLLGEQEPLELVYIPDKDNSYIFVGGTTYPGDVYKPLCKVLNAKVFANGGIEIHGAGISAHLGNSITDKTKENLIIISGLSLHGKTTLSVANISDKQKMETAEKLGVEHSELKIELKLLHDDYLYLMPGKNGCEIGVYAPNGIFPAMHKNKSDNLITSKPEAILFNTNINDDGTPDFESDYLYKNRYSEEEKRTTNQRAAAPIRGSFQMPIVKSGRIQNPNEIVFITLTRDPAAPSAIRWQNIEDAVVYSAGLVVAPTDAVIDRVDGLYLNYMCTDFDVAPRTEFVKKMIEIFVNLKKSGTTIRCYTINTGKPDKEESLAVRDAIICDDGEWKSNTDLGIDYIARCAGYESPYIPWETNPEVNWTKRWEETKRKRRDFFKTIGVELGNSITKKLRALI